MISKQLETFTNGMDAKGISRLEKAYVPGLGAALLQGAPESFKKLEGKLELEKLRSLGRQLTDQESYLVQLALMKQIREQIEQRKQEELDRQQRLINAFKKLVINEPKLSEGNKLFTNVEGSNIQKHVKKNGDLRERTVALQQVLGKTNISNLTEASRSNLIKEIETISKKNTELEKSEVNLKPDKESVNKAFLKGAKMGSDKFLKALNTHGFEPGDGIKAELSSEMAKGGVARDETVKMGKEMGLGERIIKTVFDTARYLFTPTEKYLALTDKSVTDKETVVETKNGNAKSVNSMLSNEREEFSFLRDNSSLKDQIEKVASKLDLKIDWNISNGSSENSESKKQELSY